MTILSRRTLLKAAGIASAAGGLGFATLGRAFATDAPAAPVSVSDGSLVLPVDLVLPGRDRADVEAALGPERAASGTITPDCNVTLWRTDGRTVLFDAGSGPMFMPSAGALVESLAAAGVAPEDVTDVVMTHAHPDHIWGVLDEFDDLTFAEARYHVPRAEWDFWSADETLARLPEAQHAFLAGARNRFAAIEAQTVLVAPGDEVLPGVEAVDTGGHTPGHLSYLVHAGEPVLVVGDALSHAVVSFAYPDWRWGSDLEPDRAIATRRALLDRIATERVQIIGFHLPTPGRGRAERKGTVYRFVAD